MSVGSVLFTCFVVLIHGVDGPPRHVEGVHALLGQPVPQLDPHLRPLVCDHALAWGWSVSVPSSSFLDPANGFKIRSKKVIIKLQ